MIAFGKNCRKLVKFVDEGPEFEKAKNGYLRCLDRVAKRQANSNSAKSKRSVSGPDRMIIKRRKRLQTFRTWNRRVSSFFDRLTLAKKVWQKTVSADWTNVGQTQCRGEAKTNDHDDETIVKCKCQL